MSNMAPPKRNEKSKEKATVFPGKLINAIIRNNEKGVKKQISCGASLNALNVYGQSPLQVAIEHDNINVVKIIADNGADINQETRFGTPFYYAASLGITDLIMKHFLDKGVNVNVRNRNGDTALHAICRQLDDLETCTFLLKHGADPTLENGKKETPLDCAYQKLTPICNSLFSTFSSSDLEKWVVAMNCISEFLDYGVDLSNISQECPYILYGAVKAENVKLVKYLMTRVDSSIFGKQMRPREGAKTIQLAIKQKNLEIIKILVDKEVDIPAEINLGILFSFHVHTISCDIVNYFLQKGTDVNWKDHSGNTALHLVSMAELSENSTEICRILLNHGAALDEVNNDKYTPLQLAIRKNNLDIVEVLVNAGADVRHETKCGNPFHLAAFGGRLDIMDYLLENGVHIDDKNGNGNTALHETCIVLWDPTYPSCKHLLKRGANINARNNENETPLFYALRSVQTSIDTVYEFETWNIQKIDGYETLFAQLLPKLDIIHYFLEHGVNLDDVLDECPNILHAAVAAGNEKFVEFLLQQNMKVDRRMNEDATPLHCAAFFGRLEVMATLIHHGANINATMSKKLTPLHLASCQGHVSFAIALMNFGADFDAQDDWGRTALHNAVFFQNVAIVWALLLRGVNTGIKDINDKQAYDLNPVGDEYAGSIYTEATALVSNAFFRFCFRPIYFVYNIKENLQYNYNPERLDDYSYTWSIFEMGSSLKEKKDKILKMNKKELIGILEAKTPDSVFAQEVILMRDTAICDNVTLYDSLTKDTIEIARYFVDTEIPDFTAFSRNGFFWLLQTRMNAVRRYNLFGWAANELGQRLQVRLPQEVMDEVVKNLDEQDVKNILRATIAYEEDKADDEKKIQEAEEEFETTFEVRSCAYYPKIREDYDFDDDYYDYYGGGGDSDYDSDRFEILF